MVRPQLFAGCTEWGCAQKKDPIPGVFSLLRGQGVRAALTVRGKAVRVQVRCQQFLRVLWLQASQRQGLEKWDICKSSGPGIELRISWKVESGLRLFWEKEKHLILFGIVSRIYSLRSRAIVVQFCPWLSTRCEQQSTHTH